MSHQSGPPVPPGGWGDGGSSRGGPQVVRRRNSDDEFMERYHQRNWGESFDKPKQLSEDDKFMEKYHQLNWGTSFRWPGGSQSYGEVGAEDRGPNPYSGKMPSDPRYGFGSAGCYVPTGANLVVKPPLPYGVAPAYGDYRDGIFCTPKNGPLGYGYYRWSASRGGYDYHPFNGDPSGRYPAGGGGEHALHCKPSDPREVPFEIEEYGEHPKPEMKISSAWLTLYAQILSGIASDGWSEVRKAETCRQLIEPMLRYILEFGGETAERYRVGLAQRAIELGVLREDWKHLAKKGLVKWPAKPKQAAKTKGEGSVKTPTSSQGLIEGWSKDTASTKGKGEGSVKAPPSSRGAPSTKGRRFGQLGRLFRRGFQ